MNAIQRKQTGFTLVELLIVIVVIAILAAISVVAFNGIQQRAKMASLATALDAYQKGMEMYKIDHGGYPDATTLCLGVSGDLPATANYSTDECGESDYTNIRDDSLNTALEPYIGNAPSLGYIDEIRRNSYGHTFRGVMVSITSNWYEFWYAVKLDTQCPVGEGLYVNTYRRICIIDKDA